MGILNNNYRRKNRRRNRSKSTSMFHEKYPRLVVYRSNRHFEGQIINDFESKTLVSASSKDSSLKNIFIIKIYEGKFYIQIRLYFMIIIYSLFFNFT